MTPSKTFFYGCVCLLVGVGISLVIQIPQVITWGILFAGVSVAIGSLFTHRKFFLVVGFCLLFFAMGISRLQTAEFSMANDMVAKLNDTGQKITLQGRIIEDPDVRDTSERLKVLINTTKSVVLVSTSKYPTYHYLDRIQITGALKTPAISEDFNYKNYLARDGIYSVIDYPKIQLLQEGQPQNIAEITYGKLLEFKHTLRESINHYFAPPHSFIVEGVMLGSTGNMPGDLKDKFSVTGLTHLTAISGSNIVILSSIMMAFLLFLGFWRGQAFYISTIFIWLYVAIAAFPASGIRAAIMASIFLLSQKLGRQNVTVRVIVLAATIMVLQKPLILLYDVGFQLSFLASLGIILAKPLIDRVLSRLRTKKFKNLVDIFSVTMSAQLFTLPLIVYYFGNMSLVSPLTNILIIPIIDWIMIFGFLASFLGIWSYMLGFIFSFPAWILLSYFMGVLDIFYQPWAFVSFGHVSLAWIAAYYAILFFAIMWWRKRQKAVFSPI